MLSLTLGCGILQPLRNGAFLSYVSASLWHGLSCPSAAAAKFLPNPLCEKGTGLQVGEVTG